MESKDEYIFILCLLFVIKMEICKLQGQILERIVQADFDICKRNLSICVRNSTNVYFSKMINCFYSFKLIIWAKHNFAIISDTYPVPADSTVNGNLTGGHHSSHWSSLSKGRGVNNEIMIEKSPGNIKILMLVQFVLNTNISKPFWVYL